jgi:BirA family biotin operon repressor/biotin-[acetyl-CoA-carboxylase] ligase
MLNPLFIGKVLIELDKVDSTNNYARNLLSNSKPMEGTVIIAQEQFAGRGQFGNSWLTQPGQNLTFSLILYPRRCPADKQFNLNKAICLGLIDFLQQFNLENLSIKWPNDIYCKDRKLAGILIENTIQGALVKESIIGIGLNINQREFPSGSGRPSSLSLETGNSYSLELIRALLFEHLEYRYLQFQQENPRLHQDYLALLYQKGITAKYMQDELSFEGIIQDVDSTGRLQVQVGEELRSFAFKQISFLPPA